jgi:hypothetical protein
MTAFPKSLIGSVTPAQYAFLRHTIRMGGSRSISRRRAVARHCMERGYGTVTGLRFFINRNGRALFE